MLDAAVFLELWVKVKEGWRNNQYQMRNFGYGGSVNGRGQAAGTSVCARWISVTLTAI